MPGAVHIQPNFSWDNQTPFPLEGVGYNQPNASWLIQPFSAKKKLPNHELIHQLGAERETSAFAQKGPTGSFGATKLSWVP